MNRQATIDKTITVLERLSDDKLMAVYEYVDFLKQKNDGNNILNEISIHASNSKVFEFLNNESEDYQVEDLLEVYDEKR